MSMMGMFRQVSPELLEKLVEDPSLVSQLVFQPFSGMNIVTSEAKELLGQHLQQMKESIAESIDDWIQHLPPEQRAPIEALSSEERRELGRAFADHIARVRGWDSWTGSRGTHVEVGEDLEGVGPLLEVDKAWHGIHFLLCGDAEGGEPPLSNAVLGGVELGEDLGYGPARYLEPPEVREVAVALARLDVAALKGRFSADRLNEANVYPGGWEQKGHLEWLLEAYESLRDFYRDAAAHGNAVILYLT